MDNNYNANNVDEQTTEYTETTTTIESSSVSSSGPYKGFKESSPDEVKERVKDTVAKGIAAVAGALKGFSDEVEKNHLAETTRTAIQRAGETTREVISTTTEQVRGLRQPIQDAGAAVKETTQSVAETVKDTTQSVAGNVKSTGHSVAEQARDLGKTAKDEVHQTKEHLGIGSKGSSSSSSDLSTGSGYVAGASSTDMSGFGNPSLGSTPMTSSYNSGVSGGLGGASSPVDVGGGTNPVGGNVYPGGSDLRGSSLQEDAMQSTGSVGSNTAGVPDLRKTTLGTQEDIKDANNNG